MRKIRLFIGTSLFLALFSLVSCPGAFEMPTKARVKTNAAFTFTAPEADEDVIGYFDDAIRDGLGGQGSVKIFDYAPPSGGDFKAYLIHYKVDPIEFPIGPVEIDDFAVDEIPLNDSSNKIEVPNTFTCDPVTFPPLTWTGPDEKNIGTVSGGSISLGAELTKVVIENGVLSIGSETDGFDYSALVISIGGQTLQKAPGAQGRNHSLAGIVLEGNPSLSCSGKISSTTGTLSSLTPAITIGGFTEITVQTDSNHTGSETTSIDLDSVPDGVNFITLDHITVDLQFTADYGSGDPVVPVRVDGLPIVFGAPLLGFSAGATPYTSSSFATPANTGCKITQGETLSFAVNDHILYFDSSYYEAGKGVLVDRSGDPSNNTGVEVTVNPAIDGAYAKITLYNLTPGNVTISVKPQVTLEIASVNINLDTFVKAEFHDPGENPLEGSFPNDDEGLNIAELFDDMGTMGKNVSFDELGLYLYINGDTDKLTDTTFKLEALAAGVPKPLTGTETNRYIEFENLTVPAPNFGVLDTFTGDLAGTGQFHTVELVDIVNDKPAGLKINYGIRLAENLEIPGDQLQNGRNIVLRPEMALVVPLRLRLYAEDGANYGVMKVFEDDEPGGDMFDRTGPDDEFNDYLKQLARVALNVDYDNTLGLDQVSVYMVSHDTGGRENLSKKLTLEEGTGKRLILELDTDDLSAYPLWPELEIRVPAEQTDGGGKRYGIIELKRGTGAAGAGIRANISVDIESQVDLEFDL
jgi:hypothetical protein